MSPDLAATVVLLASAFAGALVSSFSGFAFAPVAGVVLLIAFAPKEIVPVLMVCSVIVQTSTLFYLRQSLVFRSIKTMLAGGTLGVPLAVLLFQRIDAHTFQIAFGVFLAAYAILMLLRPCTFFRIGAHRGHEVAVGFLGGLIGGLTAMPGAVPVLYCDCKGVSKEVQRATVQPFILAMQVLALVVMAVQGQIDGGVARLVTLALPGLALGIVVGLVLFGRVPDAGFRQVVLLLLLGTGLALAARPSRGRGADAPEPSLLSASQPRPATGLKCPHSESRRVVVAPRDPDLAQGCASRQFAVRAG
jgi:uncharacterized protein